MVAVVQLKNSQGKNVHTSIALTNVWLQDVWCQQLTGTREGYVQVAIETSVLLMLTIQISTTTRTSTSQITNITHKISTNIRISTQHKTPNPTTQPNIQHKYQGEDVIIRIEVNEIFLELILIFACNHSNATLLVQVCMECLYWLI